MESLVYPALSPTMAFPKKAMGDISISELQKMVCLGDIGCLFKLSRMLGIEYSETSFKNLFLTILILSSYAPLG
jgi:hypothetical protein